MSTHVEFEVGVSPSGVLLSIKKNEGRLHQISALEVTNEEAERIAHLILKRVAENRQAVPSSEIN
ncbi:MAG: hypothetical protein ACO4AU_10720 [bacterium]